MAQPLWKIVWWFHTKLSIRSDQIRSDAQSCPTLCDPMNRSTPGLPVLQLLEFTETHVHRVSDAIQPSHPPSSPSPPAPNPSQHQSLFQRVNSSHEVAKVLEFQLQHHSFQRNPRADLLQNGLIGSPWSPRDSQESSPTPQFKSINSSAFSFLYSPTLTSIRDYWKNHSLNQTDLFWQSNLCFLICCLHWSYLSFQGISVFYFMAVVTICSDFGAQENKVSHCFHCFPIYLP